MTSGVHVVVSDGVRPFNAEDGSQMLSVAFVQLAETCLWNGPTATVIKHDWNNDGVIDQQSLL
jgi:hypothetical protein